MEPTKDSKNTTKTTKTTKTDKTITTEENIPVQEVDKDATIVTGQAGDQPVTVVMNPPKKHKVGIIVGIVIFLLFLIGGGALAAWYFCIYNSPEVVAYDAVRQLVSAEHVSTSGTVRIASSEPDKDGNITVAELKLTSASMRLPVNTYANLNISERNRNNEVVDDHEISLGLSFTVLSDGTIYFKTGDLSKTIDKALSAEDADLDELDDMGQFAYAIVELLDNQTWQISLGDVLDEMDLDHSIADPITDFYNCALSATQESDDLAKLYDAHRFIQISKTDQAADTSGDTRYQVALDYAVMADFVNALPETAGAEKAIVCYNNLADEFDFDHLSTSDFPEVEAKDLEKILPDDHQLYLEISDFGHQLRCIELKTKNDDVEINVDLGFDYAAVEVTAPTDYRPVTDLFEEVFGLVGEYFYGLDDSDLNQGAGAIFI